MNNLPRRLVLAVKGTVVAVTAAVLAACGSSDDTPATVTDTKTVMPPSSTSTSPFPSSLGTTTGSTPTATPTNAQQTTAQPTTPSAPTEVEVVTAGTVGPNQLAFMNALDDAYRYNARLQNAQYSVYPATNVVLSAEELQASAPAWSNFGAELINPNLPGTAENSTFSFTVTVQQAEYLAGNIKDAALYLGGQKLTTTGIIPLNSKAITIEVSCADVIAAWKQAGTDEPVITGVVKTDQNAYLVAATKIAPEFAGDSGTGPFVRQAISCTPAVAMDFANVLSQGINLSSLAF